MKFIIDFALKNIWRYKKRTIITFTAISIGIAGFVILDSMLKGAHYESVRNFIDYESAHFKVYNKEFYKEMSDEGFLLLDKGIDDYGELEKKINDQGFLTAPRVSFAAQLVNEMTSGERHFTVIGIDPEKDKKVYKLSSTVLSGRFLEPGKSEIVLGRTGAKKMEVQVGDSLTILSRTKYDTYQAISVDVVGILDAPNPNISRTFAYIPLDIADSDLQMEGSITEISILSKNGKMSENLSKLNSLLNNASLQVISWEELGKDWLTLSKSKTTGSFVIIIMVFIIAAVGVINTMLMSVFERIQEIGMMRALGMRDNEVLWGFIFEGGAIGFLGAVLGLFIGAMVNIYQVYHGWDFSFVGDMDIGYRVLLVRGIWSAGSFIFAFLFSIFAPAIISIYPSRKAIKMEITQALRNA